MRILIHHFAADDWREALAQRLPTAEVVVGDENSDIQADYLATFRPPPTLLARQTRLKGIVNLAAGVDALLANPALPRDVPIIKLHDAGMAPLMIDYVRYGVLHFQRDFDRYLAQEDAASWQAHRSPAKADWPVAVLGLGAIGWQVAQALAADGYPVRGWSRSAKSIAGVRCYHGTEQLPELLAQARTLVTLLPATNSTRGMVDAELLALLPAGATLINPARGPLIDEQALLDALGRAEQPGRLRGALLDVFHDEPLPESSPLWQHPRVRITPHVAARTPVGIAADQIADAIRALEAGAPVATVDPASGY